MGEAAVAEPTRRRTFYRQDWLDVTSRRDLTHLDKLVMMYLADAQGENRDAWPSLETIARELGASKQGVHNSLARLEAAGLLDIEHGRPRTSGDRGRPNRYTVAQIGQQNGPKNGQQSRPTIGQRSGPYRSNLLTGTVNRVDPTHPSDPPQDPPQLRAAAREGVAEWARVLRIFDEAWEAVHGTALGLNAGRNDQGRGVRVVEWARKVGGDDWESVVRRAAEAGARDPALAEARHPFAAWASTPGKWLSAATDGPRNAIAELEDQIQQARLRGDLEAVERLRSEQQRVAAERRRRKAARSRT